MSESLKEKVNKGELKQEEAVAQTKKYLEREIANIEKAMKS